ncbi:hypothetical protein BU23DRAFT_568642 [Bimuria novae-zelandiae CBS 107.79]|uniref:Uncharacterized protein n=1 Tax=Bimuria novae-zelandiae CBS 107.79 TaxID=1447943 RepID=A0A6A5V8Y3_9PLEO|nr:hypothetical protein BU23DRAFT_568642 [Bimuria novae-zelandiae CBS 107.79]
MSTSKNKGALKENMNKANTTMGWRKPFKSGGGKEPREPKTADAQVPVSTKKQPVKRDYAGNGDANENESGRDVSDAVSLSDTKSEVEPPSRSTSPAEQSASRKITLAKGKDSNDGYRGKRRQGPPGVAIVKRNKKLVNYSNHKDATRLWWEQTDAFVHRWGGSDTSTDDDGEWANVHLPKTHWKTRKALAERKELKEELEEEDMLTLKKRKV